MDRTLLSFYFPTNAILLDDDISFLRHFSLLIDPELPCRSLSSAHVALEQINSQEPVARTLGNISGVTTYNDVDEKVYINLNKLHEIIYNKNRFSRISIVIVDYDMPEMNGLEFCQQIASTEIKKILFTGKADEKLAVEAFNDGLIDRYIKKGSPNAGPKLNNSIRDLQVEYFDDLTQKIHLAIANNATPFLGDRGFKAMFQDLAEKHRCVEYYISEQPQGFIMLDSNGNSGFLFVQSKDILATHYEIALSCDAPHETLELLKHGRHITWFPTADGFYTKTCNSDWQNYFYPACYTSDTGEYSCAFVSPAPARILDGTKVQSFNKYLEIFDNTYSLRY